MTHFKIIIKIFLSVPVVAQQKRIQPVSVRMWVRSLTLLSGLKDVVLPPAPGMGHRCSSEPALLWL